MTKQNLIDLIQHRLANGDCPQELKGKYHPEVISHHATLAFNYLINSIVYAQASKNNDWGALDPYAKTFMDVPVLFDTPRDEKYVELPSSYLPLPKNRGIRLVSLMQSQSKPFLYRDNNTARIYNNLDVNEVVGTPRYYVENTKLFISPHILNDVNYLLIKMIVPFDAMEEDDEVVVPQGYGKAIVDMVFQSMMGMGLEKVSNDNNANTV